MYDTFEGNFPKLSKVNSLALGSNIIYIKNIDGGYVAIDYKTKIKIVATTSKERLINWLHINKDKIEERLCKIR